MHLRNHDVEFVSVSRAPMPKIDAYRKRMGWAFKWVSSYDSDFNFDYGVSFAPGTTVVYNYREEPYQSDEPGRYGLSYVLDVWARG